MRALLAATVLAGMALAGPALSQAGGYPAAVTSRVKAMDAQCRNAGGRPRDMGKALLRTLDLTGDGRPDYVLDEAAFGCSADPEMFRGPQGSALEVFVDGGLGGTRSAFRAIVTEHAFAATRPFPSLLIAQTGEACGAGAARNAKCPRILVWESASGRFSARSREQIAAAAGSRQGSPPPRAPAAAAAPQKTAPVALSAADHAAAFGALGFTATGGAPNYCEAGSGPPSKASIEGADVNGDGRPEAWVSVTGLCYGDRRAHYLVGKTSAGSWTILLDMITSPVVTATWTRGWPDIVMGDSPYKPVNKWDGKRYVSAGYLNPRK